MKNLNLKISIFLFLFIVINYNTYSQNAMCTVNGKITNTNGNDKINGFIKFMSNNEQKAKSKIASDGTYSAVVPINSSLLISIENCVIDENSMVLNTPNNSSELVFDLKAKLLKENNIYTNFNSFEPNKSDLSSNGKEEILNFIDFADQNRRLSFKILINNKDSYFADSKVTVEKMVGNKMKTVKETMKAADLSLKLYKERTEVLEKFILESTKRKNFYAFEVDNTYLSKKPKKTKSKNTNILDNVVQNLSIIVSKVRKD